MNMLLVRSLNDTYDIGVGEMTDYDDEPETYYYLYGPRERRVNRFFGFVVASVALTSCFVITRLFYDKPLEYNEKNACIQVLCVDQEMSVEQKKDLKEKVSCLNF